MYVDHRLQQLRRPCPALHPVVLRGRVLVLGPCRIESALATLGPVHAQLRHHLAVDGVAGPQTRRALGRRGRPLLGSRTMVTGDRGVSLSAERPTFQLSAGYDHPSGWFGGASLTGVALGPSDQAQLQLLGYME